MNGYLAENSSRPIDASPDLASLMHRRALTRPVSDSGADPSLVLWNNFLVYTETYGDVLTVQALPYSNLADDLPRLHRAPAAEIWADAVRNRRYPPSMEYARQLNIFYATDLFVFNNELYAYTTVGIDLLVPPEIASKVRAFNDLFRIFLLKCDGSDPLGSWSIVERIVTPWDLMAIDPCPVETKNGLLFFWSGHTPKSFFLNIMAVPMKSLSELEGNASILLSPDEEHEEEVNEGPTPLVLNGEIHGMFYSRGNVWKKNYRLEYADCTGDPLQSSSWSKRSAQVWYGEDSADGIKGLGHGAVILDPNLPPQGTSGREKRGNYYWLLYQYKRGINSTPAKRAVAAQTFFADDEGNLDFGVFLPVAKGQAPSKHQIAELRHDTGLSFSELSSPTKEYLIAIAPATAPYL
jgi:GH43 family beta-xylosidase